MTRERTDHIVRQWYGRVEREFGQRGIAIPDNPTVRFLFLNWYGWTLRYGVNLTYIVDAVLQYYEKPRAIIGKPRELGVRVDHVTGVKFEEHLVQRISWDYPDGELLDARRSDAMRRIFRLHSRVVERGADPDAFIDAYVARGDELRNGTAHPAKTVRRPWRGNPWRT